MSEAALRKALKPLLHEFRLSRETWDGEPVTVSYDPYYNLMGALIDMEQMGWKADKVSRQTLKSVARSLGKISAAVDKIRAVLEPSSPAKG